MDHPYGEYKSHMVVGILYEQIQGLESEKTVYSISQLDRIKSVIEIFIFFVHPKWKIALDRPGSGNTRNIVGTDNIEKLISGSGRFSELGE